MGSDVGQNPDLVEKYTRAVVESTHIPVIAKMTPNIGNMEIPAIAAKKGGASGIAAINTIKAITNIDVENMTAMPVVNAKSSISGYSGDRKSTRLNSSHANISYAVFCLKKK